MMKPHKGMKSQDILILMHVLLYSNGIFKVAQLAEAMQISQSEISESLNRSRIARLLNNDKLVFRHNLLEFVLFGLKYVFPAIPGAIARGVPTSHSGPPLRDKIQSGDEQYVWPAARGSLRGMSIEPLFRTVPAICLAYPELYEVLCLVDALRIGKQREVALASDLLKERILNNGK